jgi:hypothetical protein
MRRLGADTDFALFASHTQVANIDIVTAGGEICASQITQSNVAAARGVVTEGIRTHCDVGVAHCVAKECIATGGRVV